MPASTVTVCASGSSATTSSIDFKDRKLSVLSAMLLKRVGRVQAVRAVLEITRPIRQFVLCRPGQERRDHRACHQCREEPDKSPLIHCCIPSRIGIGNRNSLNLGFESAAIVHLFFLFSSCRFGWSSLKALRA